MTQPKRTIPAFATESEEANWWLENRDAHDRDFVTAAANGELARRLGVRETVVRRMLDPDHATRLENIERALLAAGAHLYLALDAA